MTIINNIAGSAKGVSAAANNNNIETLKGMIIAGHDGAKDFGYAEYGRDWFVNYGDYAIYINRCYGDWGFSIYKNYKSSWTEDGRKVTYDDILTPHTIYINGKWSKSLVENMAKFIIDTIADYESQSDWADFLDMCDRKDDIVSSYQTEIDGYVQDILMISDRKSDIEYKMEAFAIKEIVKKIAQTEQDCYDAITDAECDCFGMEIDLMGLWLWYNNYSQDYTDPCFDRECIDLGELIDTLDYMCGMEWDMPLAEDDVVESVAEDTPWLPMATPLYLDDAVIDYVSTYYHYAYCA